MLNLYPTGNMDAIAQEDESAASDIQQIIAALALWNYFRSVEQWHRRKWLSSVANAAGVSVDNLVERPSGVVPVGGARYPVVPQSNLGGAIQNRAARRAASAGLVSTAKQAVRVAGGQLTPNAALVGIDAVLGNAVASNVALVRSVSDQTRARIANAVFNGLANNTPAEDVAREIRKGINISRARALRIAKNETIQATKALNRFRMVEAGFTDMEWNHTPQENPRLHHLARQGRIYAIDDPIWRDLSEPFCKCYPKPPPIPLVLGRGNAG
jgi:hypothetical protein